MRPKTVIILLTIAGILIAVQVTLSVLGIRWWSMLPVPFTLGICWFVVKDLVRLRP